MIAPMANALILTIWGLGFIGFTGINFSPLLYVLAFLVGARMVVELPPDHVPLL